MKKLIIIALLFSYIAANAQQDTIIISEKLTNQNSLIFNGKNTVLIIDTITETSAALEIRSKTRGLLLPKLDSAAMMNCRDVDGMWFYSTYFGTSIYWGGRKAHFFRPVTQQFYAEKGDTVEVFLANTIYSVSYEEGDFYIDKSPTKCVEFSYLADTVPLRENALNITFTGTYIYLKSDTSSISVDETDNYIFDGSLVDFGYGYDFHGTRYWVKKKYICHEYEDNYTLVRDKVILHDKDPTPHVKLNTMYFVNKQTSTNVLITYQ